MRSVLLILAMLCYGAMAQVPAQAQTPMPVQEALQGGDPGSFTVLAEPQLALPMAEISRLYSLRKGVTMLTAFDDSVTQAAKLLEGETGDVLITSYPGVVTDLRQRGMADVYSFTHVTTDKLVLAAKKNSTRDDRRELLAALDAQPVLLANPQRYIEGLYGQQTLQYLFYDRPMPLPPSIYLSRNAMYQAIEQGDGIGVVLQSEAQHIEGINLTVPLADSSYPPIVYQALVIAGDSVPVARDFVQFLRGTEAQDIFVRYGFTRP